MNSNFQDWLSSIIYISGGIIVTLQYTLISVFFGMSLGALLALCKLSRTKFLKIFASTYVSIFRGTPLIIQLSLIYFAMPSVISYKVSIFEAGIIAFSLNSAAYVCEIIRAGIESIDKGQFEASKALGIPYTAMMKDIIFPQAIKNILPALVNEVINLLKETAIIYVIGGADLMGRAQIVVAEKYSYFIPLLIASAYYYLLVETLSYFAKILERKLKAND
ncbi:MAG: glutamine ABC transporter permease [Verrucomicrobia bacterium]|nr:MAG: glutamine ABC transporter permease [Verrucomicrobiota bacterium]